MTIRGSKGRRETFHSIDNNEVIDEREEHHGLVTHSKTQTIKSSLAKALKKQLWPSFYFFNLDKPADEQKICRIMSE